MILTIIHTILEDVYMKHWLDYSKMKTKSKKNGNTYAHCFLKQMDTIRTSTSKSQLETNGINDITTTLYIS